MTLSRQERQRFAAQSTATSTLLLVVFVQAVALPLLPPRLLDPLWQLAFTASLSSWGVLALLAVWLMNLAAVLNPQSQRLERRRQHLAHLCRWVVFAFLLLIPLQGLASLRALEWSQIGGQRRPSLQLQRIAQLRRAVLQADSMAALKTNLAAIQAPPLSQRDQRLSLTALRGNLLGQLQVAEARLQPRRAATTTAPEPRARLLGLVGNGLRVLLLAGGLALAFATVAQRRGSALTQLEEWQRALHDLQQAVARRRERLRLPWQRAAADRRHPDAHFYTTLAAQEEEPPKD